MDRYSEGLVDMQEIFGPDLITEGVRAKVGELIRAMLEGELEEAINAVRYTHNQGRQGHRNGTKPRKVYGGFGLVNLDVPRGLLIGKSGNKSEWRSQLLPPYQRRTNQLDSTLVSLYFSGTNLGRIKRALKPLFEEAPLSKSVISRLVRKLKRYLDIWRKRDLGKERYVYLYLDAKNFSVRIFNKVEVVPVLVALGVRIDGQKEVLAMEMQIKEKEIAWAEVINALISRGISMPELVIIDGHKGLYNAVKGAWPKVLVQRCTVHKLRNLESHCPVRLYEEVKSDYHDIVYAQDIEQARRSYRSFINKYKDRLPDVANSLEEAGEELMTFYKFPQEQWGSLRTTNPIERLNLEFERRVKTQGSLPSQESALLILWGLIVSGQIRFHKIKGYKKMPEIRHEKSLKECA